ncbi:MAG: sigma-70 family RNA polymerase sigma factor [Ectothiorhodospiraceae bacterium]|nr:sigma-70 family RNA polymerase sigma factor [Ectothiorhodospiraceae bacterium]
MLDQTSLSIYNEHRRAVIQYAASIVRDGSLAEDVVQEAFLRFQAAMHQERMENPIGYFYRIVRNLATDMVRTERRRGEIMAESAAHIGWLGLTEERCPERHTLACAEADCIRAAIEGLSERCHRVFYLRRYEGMTLAGIADTMDISVDAVRHDIKRVMKLLTASQRRFNALSL